MSPFNGLCRPTAGPPKSHPGKRQRLLSGSGSRLNGASAGWLNFRPAPTANAAGSPPATHPGVKPTNNAAEQALRGRIVLKRKISGPTRSRRGDEFIARSFSEHETCRRQRLDLWTGLHAPCRRPMDRQGATPQLGPGSDGLRRQPGQCCCAPAADQVSHLGFCVTGRGDEEPHQKPISQ